MKSIHRRLMRISRGLVIVTVWTLALISCSSRPAGDGYGSGVAPTTRGESLVQNSLVRVNRVLLAPFVFRDQVGSGGGVAGTLQEHHTAADLNDTLHRIAVAELSLEVLPQPTQRDEALSLGVKGAQSEKELADVALAEARELTADAIIIPILNQYRDRSGGSLGSEEAASIDLEMKIMRATDGVELWRGSYHYKDVALFENLLRAKQKLGNKGAPSWYSADEVLWVGARELLRKIQDERLNAFAPLK